MFKKLGITNQEAATFTMTLLFMAIIALACWTLSGCAMDLSNQHSANKSGMWHLRLNLLNKGAMDEANSYETNGTTMKVSLGMSNKYDNTTLGMKALDTANTFGQAYLKMQGVPVPATIPTPDTAETKPDDSGTSHTKTALSPPLATLPAAPSVPQPDKMRVGKSGKDKKRPVG